MEQENILDIGQLVADDKNFNKGNDEGRKLMEKSFSELGAGRSILLDKDNRIIAGNKSTEAAIATGIKKVRVIETTGDELVAVKRIDIDLDSEEGRKMALADNATQQVNLSWDETQLAAVADEIGGFDPSEWGVDMSQFGEQDNPYVQKTDIPIYEIKGKKPSIEKCIDLKNVTDKLTLIDKSNITDEQKAMLKACAYRFADINYQNMAEYYVHSDKEMQELMESLALVIVDFDKAVELGLVKMDKKMKEIYDDER